ncbi:MAG: DUF4834 family protein [Desulfonatronovibrio sp.]
MLRIIATFIIIYLIFRVLTTVVFPWIAKWYIRRYQQRFYRNNPQAHQARRKRKSGDVHISRMDDKRKPDTDRLGEYVDYEEIKEEKE